MPDTLTIAAADIQRVYVVGGVATSGFTIPWSFFSLDDVSVYIDGALQVRGTDFDITAIEAADIGYTGGTVVLVEAVTDVRVALVRSTPITRETDFPRGSALSIDVLNRDLDRLTAIAQELAFQIDRAIRLEVGDSSTPSLYLPGSAASRAGMLIGFDGTGENLVMAAPTGGEVIVSDPTKVPLTRSILAGTGLSGGGNLSGDRTLSLATSGVAPGSYAYASLTVDAYGRITGASSNSAGTGGVPTTRAITTAAPLAGGGTLAGDLALTMVDSGVTAGSYINPSVTVSAKGLITAIASNPAGAGVPTTRVLTAGAGLTGGGALDADRAFALATSGVTPATYTRATITVDAYGRVTGASSNSAGSGSGLTWVDVTAHGATGDGTTDDSAAVATAIAALSARGVLYFPAGTYKLNSALTATLQHLHVLGDGIEISRLLIAHTGVGLSIDMAGVEAGGNGVTVQGLSFLKASGSDGGTALRIRNTTPAASEARITVRDVWIRPYEVHGTSVAFTTGIDLQYTRFHTFENISIWGHDDGGASSGEHGIRWQSNTSIAAFQLVGTQISIFNYYFGIYASGAIEGLYLRGGEIWEGMYGIYVDRTGVGNAGGAVLISGMHINSGSQCVTVINSSAVQLIGNDFYHGCGGAGLTNLSGHIVLLSSVAKLSVVGNKFESAYAGASINGLTLDSCADFSVTGNTFMRIAATAVWLANSTTRGVVTGNQVNGDTASGTATGITAASGASSVTVAGNRIGNVAAIFSNSSSTITMDHQGPRGARVVVNSSTTQSIGSGDTQNLASFFSSSTEDYDTDNIHGSGRMTVPSNLGVTRMRLTANIAVTGGASSGHVQLTISKNGSTTWAGAPRQEGPTYNGNSVSLQVTTGVISVSAGDYFEVVAVNNTGASVTVTSGGSRAACFFEAEVIS